MGWDLRTSLLSFQEDYCHTPVLSRPRLEVPPLLYLLVVDEAIISALVQEEGKHQLPIYFTSLILHDAKKHYQMIEKVALALFTSTQRPMPFF